jgi:hypothetical protein
VDALLRLTHLTSLGWSWGDSCFGLDDRGSWDYVEELQKLVDSIESMDVVKQDLKHYFKADLVGRSEEICIVLLNHFYGYWTSAYHAVNPILY